MNIIQATKKREYSVPKIEEIKLDKDISLAMESDAPAGPGEGSLYKPDNCTDPYKSNMA